MLEPVPHSVAELASAAASDHCLIVRRPHSLLESLPGGVRGVSELSVVRFKLEELGSPLHAQGLSRLLLIVGRTLDEVNVLLLPLMQDLLHVLPEHGLVGGPEFPCVRYRILERLLCHYILRNVNNL